MCQCACFYSAFEVSPHSLRLCLQGEKKKEVKPQGGNILTFIFASDTESLFSSYFRERSHEGVLANVFITCFLFQSLPV